MLLDTANIKAYLDTPRLLAAYLEYGIMRLDGVAESTQATTPHKLTSHRIVVSGSNLAGCSILSDLAFEILRIRHLVYVVLPLFGPMPE